jgi:hypothetical protein
MQKMKGLKNNIRFDKMRMAVKINGNVFYDKREKQMVEKDE